MKGCGVQEEEEEYNPFWQGGAAAVFLSAIMFALYLYMAAPAQLEADQMQAKVDEVNDRIVLQRQELEYIQAKCVELERGDPQTLRETIRQELVKGQRLDFLP